MYLIQNIYTKYYIYNEIILSTSFSVFEVFLSFI